MPNFGHSEFLSVFFALKYFKKIWNAQFWPFQISSSFFFGTKMFQKNLECPILAILNFFQFFFCTKMFQKIQNAQFWPFQISSQCFFALKCFLKIQNAQFWSFQISSSLLHQNGFKNFRMANFGQNWGF